MDPIAAITMFVLALNSLIASYRLNQLEQQVEELRKAREWDRS
jgi:hypothetical protein